MPLYMDHHHKVEGLTAEAVAGAHQRDLEVQAKHGVNILKYWFDEGTGAVFCLVDAPNKEAAEAVHPEAHCLGARENSRGRVGVRSQQAAAPPLRFARGRGARRAT